jgi:hypothetical protein
VFSLPFYASKTNTQHENKHQTLKQPNHGPGERFIGGAAVLETLESLAQLCITLAWSTPLTWPIQNNKDFSLNSPLAIASLSAKKASFPWFRAFQIEQEKQDKRKTLAISSADLAAETAKFAGIASTTV